jgi:phage-related protein
MLIPKADGVNMPERQTSKLVYQGAELRLEFYRTDTGELPAEAWLESQREKIQHKFAALFAWIGDHGKIFNERKFKHLAGSEQIFEFKADAGRVLCFFFTGKRLVLTHGFAKKGDKTPKGEIERAEAMKNDFWNRENQWEPKPKKNRG